MSETQYLDEVDGSACETGIYLITTVNGSVYEIVVTEDAAATMRRMVHAVPPDPEYGRQGNSLYGDGELIPLIAWSARRGQAGAAFYFYAEGARQAERVEDYPGTLRRTSAVISIQRVDLPDEQEPE
ncbi:hypothetical protein [Leucobacter sp. GX24907]